MTTSRHRATTAEIEERRAEVVRLRFAGLSEREIAKRVAVSAPTVSRDLAAARAEFGRSHNAAHEVGEGVSLFALLEATAIRELVRLEAEGTPATGAKMQCCWLAKSARQARLDLLHAMGLGRSALGSRVQKFSFPFFKHPHLTLQRAEFLFHLCEFVRNLLFAKAGSTMSLSRKFLASSTESMGEFRLRQSPKLVVASGLHHVVGSETTCLSDGQFRVGVQALHDTTGNFTFGSNPVQE